MQFQLTSNKYDKTNYRTIDATNLIDSIKCLKIPNQGVTHKDLVENYGSQFSDLTKEIKNTNPYIFPYSVKDLKEGLIKTNIDKLQFLVLDIDDSCSIEQFIKMNIKYKYYLHTTTTHKVAGVDKFRVIFPINESMDIADAISRKTSIQNYFSFGDKTYLDTSFLIKGRGFVVPIDLEYFFEFESQNEDVLDLNMFDQGFVKVSSIGEKIKTVEGMDTSPAVEALVKLYLDESEENLITVNGREYSRNDAFYIIHIEIAKFRVSEEYQVQLAHRMNWDDKRNSIEVTVANARKACRHIDISALRAKSFNYSVKTKETKFLQVEDVKIEEGKKHLLTATTGTGKTTLVLDKMERKVIFASPLNSIIEQQSINRNYETLKGTSGVLPSTDKILCSYDALIALLDKNDLSDYLIVLDEFHRVLTDGFRIETMSGLLERLKVSSYSILCMSGTFDPTHLDWFKFDYHFDFKADRPIRPVNVLETTGSLDHALIRFIKGLNPTDNNLILFDDKNKALAIHKVLPDITVISADSKEDEVYNQLLASGEINGTVLTTQVLLEGINLKNVNNIVIVATKYWSEEQIVQFYERDRDRKSNCYLLRKPIKEADDYIPDAFKEKEYQNSFFRVIKDLGVCKVALIGGKDMNKLIRHDGSEVYMNVLYPYWKQKSSMDIANFREGLQLEKYGYKLIDKIGEISPASVSALDKVKNLSAEMKHADYALAVEKALEGEQYNGEFSSTFSMIGILLDNGFSKNETRDIASEPKELEAYKDRITQPLPVLEKALYDEFKVGDFYSTANAKSIITKAITNSPQTMVRVNKNHHVKILSRYFHIKRKTTKKGFEIVAIRIINNAEL